MKTLKVTPLQSYEGRTVKLAVDVKTNKVLMGFSCHADMISKHYDEWVRAIYFPQFDKIYVRFWKRDGDYNFVKDIDQKRSYFIADSAIRELERQGYITRKTVVLYWETDNDIRESMIKW